MRRFASRRSLTAAAAAAAFAVLLGGAEAQNTRPAQQNAEPQAQPSAQSAAPGQENRKSSGTNDQSGPSNAAPTTDQQSQGDQAVHSTPGRAGKEEPGSHAPTQAQGEATPVLVNGNWNVPGAPADSQTVPAKFSERNAELDKLPTMAFPLALTDAQKQKIAASVRTGNAPTATLDAKITEELDVTVELRDLSEAIKAEMSGVNKLKYVPLADRILLVNPSNRVVVGEIKN